MASRGISRRCKRRLEKGNFEGEREEARSPHAAAPRRWRRGQQSGAKARDPFGNCLIKGLNFTSRLFGTLLS
ncbi:unnamed protein product [Urochloa decumbens]|uniref:Uncharacterized protein n=1 Tax=Urochloa decumbens TaxID=240449 RepID=A0ABC9AE70_9POAL